MAKYRERACTHCDIFCKFAVRKDVSQVLQNVLMEQENCLPYGNDLTYNNIYIYILRNKVIALCTLACMFGTEGSKAQFIFDNQAELAAARMGSQQVAVYRANLGLMLVVL